MGEVKYTIDSPEGGVSALFSGSLDVALKAMDKVGFHLISSYETTLLRIVEFDKYKRKIDGMRDNGGNVNLFDFSPRALMIGNMVSEGVVYVPGDRRYMTRKSPVLKRPEEFVAAEKARRNFYITNKELEEALSDSVKIPYRFNGEISQGRSRGDSDNQIPLDKLNGNEVTEFFFRKSMGGFDKYIEVLEAYGIDFINISLKGEDYVNKQEQPFSKQLSLGGIVNVSSIWTADKEIRGYYSRNPVSVEVDDGLFD